MKSVKVLLGTVLCLVMLSGQAMADTTKILDFNNVSLTSDGLGAYGAANGVSLDGWFLAAPNGNVGLQEMAFGTQTTAYFQFNSNDPVGLFSFDYIYNVGDTSGYDEISMPKVTISGYDKTFNKLLGQFTLNPTNSLDLQSALVPDSWANFFLGKIVFTIKQGSFIIDNVTLNTAPTPLPGAAIFLFSGLLGLVGLRRRQIV